MKFYLLLTLVSIAQFNNAFVIDQNTESISQTLSENESSSKTSVPEFETVSMISTANEEITTQMPDSKLLTNLNEGDMNTAESSIVFRPLFAYRKKKEKERKNDKPTPSKQTISNRQQKVYVAYPYYYYPHYSNYYPTDNNYYPYYSNNYNYPHYSYPYYYNSPY